MCIINKTAISDVFLNTNIKINILLKNIKIIYKPMCSNIVSLNKNYSI